MVISWVGFTLQFSATYAKCTRVGRRVLWQAMKEVKECYSSPWLITGDFNVISNINKRSGGGPPNDRNMEEFNEAITDCGLSEVAFDGPIFTWTNGRVWQRLDRALANEGWMEIFEITKVSHLVRGRSDHTPLLIKYGGSGGRSSAFRFLNVWTKHSSFRDVVNEAWQVPVSMGGMLGFHQRLLNVKGRLREWNRRSFGNIFQAVLDAEEMLRVRQGEYDATRDASPDGGALTSSRGLRMMQDGGWRMRRLLRAQWATPVMEFSLPTLTPEDNDDLQRLPSLAELQEAISAMARDSARGPDGFGAAFYQECWAIIHKELLEAVQEFFREAPQPKGFSSALIVLIPKVAGASNWSIADNILLAQELVLDLDRRVKCPNLMLKLDMEKAYDRVEWRFLIFMLRRFGFHEKVVDLIFRTLSNNWFSVLVNGTPTGFFKSTRGVRQGDLLSPALFVLVAEFLGGGLYHLFCLDKSRFFVSSGSQVPYLDFADDILIFTRCSEGNLDALKEFLESYQAYSGQKVNASKSAFIMANRATGEQRDLVASKLQFQQLCLPFTYLGSLISRGRERCILLDAIVSRMRDRLCHWSSRLLSSGGKLILLRHVLTSMPMYLLQAAKPSPLWRWLERVRGIVEQNIRWCVNKGFVDFWYDRWLGDSLLAELLFLRDPPHMLLAEFYGGGGWRINHLRRWIPNHLVQQVQDVMLHPEQRDCMIWARLGVQVTRRTEVVVVSWKRPPRSSVKLNTDASVVLDQAYGGGLLRDSNGRVIFTFHKELGKMDVLESEGLALLHGLRLCAGVVTGPLLVEVDSESLVRMLHSSGVAKWPLYTMLRRIRSLLDSLSASISHVVREANAAADKLAGLRSALYCTSYSQLPRSVRTAVLLNSREFPFPRCRSIEG
ncbi:uncharacterized protein [Coffea arabica]|uniref:Reverse transcriptase domain-containing protein n=1 Tax=Coffea arabica TaxID=13443 RepID=A0ABM4U4J5_COFAR